MRFSPTFLLWLFLLSLAISAVEAVEHPEELVNLLAGSFTDGDRFSTGNTLPLIGRPWGFNHWAPQTKDGSRRTGSWWFKGSDHQFTWLRCTHQPSPWIGDWGWFLFGPQMNGASRNPLHFWEPRAALLKPYLLDATVAPYGIRMELTPTDHGAYLRVTFPVANNGGKRICFAEARWGTLGQTSNGGPYFEGKASQVNSDRMVISNFGMNIRADSLEAVKAEDHQDMRCFIYKKDATVVTVRIATSLISPAQAVVNMQRELPAKKSFEEVLLESKLVWHQLMKRVDVMDAGGDGDASAASTKHLQVFYTGLYRALTFPRRIDEIDANGNMVHYSPYDPRGGVHAGPLVTDNGFWDTFRTVYPLLSLIYPDHLGVIIQGWLNAYKEGGWLPSWASPGYRNCMVGTFADVVVADAIVKQVPNFDLTLAKDAMLKDSFSSPPAYAGGSQGKQGLDQYKNRGFLPMEGGNAGGGEVVSRTLDYGFADFAVAQALVILANRRILGKNDPQLASTMRQQAQDLYTRSHKATGSLFDKGRGLMCPKASNGQFTQRFDAVEWGKGYTEGNAWHHSFPPYAISPYVPVSLNNNENNDHNNNNKNRNKRAHPNTVIEGADGVVGNVDPNFNTKHSLMSLYGSTAALRYKLHALLTTPAEFRPGSYGQEIHEMTEMRALALGQYGHNNQPVHHILYLFALLGDAETTQRMVRVVMDRAYGIDFYAGDEDNGEQGSWFVLSALGLYSVTPGTTSYVLGSPLFRHVRISRNFEPYDPFYETAHHTKTGTAAHAGEAENSAHSSDTHQYLDIFALGTSPETVYVDKITLNGQTLSGYTVEDPWLQQHAVLRFYMRGELNSEDIESMVQTVHATASDELEQQRRDNSAPGAIEKHMSELARLKHEISSKDDKINEMKLQLAAATAATTAGKSVRYGTTGDQISSSSSTSLSLTTWVDAVRENVLYLILSVIIAMIVLIKCLDWLYHYIVAPRIHLPAKSRTFPPMPSSSSSSSSFNESDGTSNRNQHEPHASVLTLDHHHHEGNDLALNRTAAGGGGGGGGGDYCQQEDTSTTRRSNDQDWKAAQQELEASYCCMTGCLGMPTTASTSNTSSSQANVSSSRSSHQFGWGAWALLQLVIICVKTGVYNIYRRLLYCNKSAPRTEKNRSTTTTTSTPSSSSSTGSGGSSGNIGSNIGSNIGISDSSASSTGIGTPGGISRSSSSVGRSSSSYSRSRKQVV